MHTGALLCSYMFHLAWSTGFIQMRDSYYSVRIIRTQVLARASASCAHARQRIRSVNSDIKISHVSTVYITVVK